jgi:hypothetical protein
VGKFADMGNDEIVQGIVEKLDADTRDLSRHDYMGVLAELIADFQGRFSACEQEQIEEEDEIDE